jgi:hypothetical protein
MVTPWLSRAGARSPTGERRRFDAVVSATGSRSSSGPERRWTARQAPDRIRGMPLVTIETRRGLPSETKRLLFEAGV